MEDRTHQIKAEEFAAKEQHAGSESRCGRIHRTAAVMIREPEKKKEQQQRRPAGKLSPWS